MKPLLKREFLSLHAACHVLNPSGPLLEGFQREFKNTGWVGPDEHRTYPALVVLYSTLRIGLHGSGFFPSLGCFPNMGQMAKKKKKKLVQITKLQSFFFYHSTSSSFSKMRKTLHLKRASKNTLGFASTRLCVYIQYKQMGCIQQFLPCGVMICAGLAGDLTFHVVRVPSEWLQTNCLPSWCQATEWMALKRQHRISRQ